MPTTTPTKADAVSTGDIIPTSQEDSSERKFYFWDGNMPRPWTPIAKHFATTSIETQHLQVTAIFDLMNKDTFSILDLQNLPFTCAFIAHLPGNLRKVRVMHGLGANQVSSLADTVAPTPMVLSGDFVPGALDPQVYVFDGDIVQPKEYHIPTQADFDSMIEIIGQAPPRTKPTLFKAKEVHNTFAYTQLVPVPPYMVYDGLTDDMDALILYERFLNACEVNRSAPHIAPFRQALEFLRLGAVSTTANFNNPSIPWEVLATPPSRSAARWRSNRLEMWYATTSTSAPEDTEQPASPNGTDASIAILEPVDEEEATPLRTPSTEPATEPEQTETAPSAQVPPPQAHPAPTAPAPSAPPKEVITLTKDMFLELLNRATKEKVTTITPATSKSFDDSDSEEEDNLGLSKSTYLNILGMCGLEDGQEDSIPLLWRQLAEKNIKEADKAKHIRFALTKNMKYKSCRVPCLHSIVTMVRKRTFEGDVTTDDLANTVKGLSPFCVPALTAQQIALHNQMGENIDSATHTTVKDVASNKLTCTVPKTFEGLLKHLKRFCNLVFAIFGEKCPLMLMTVDLIDTLDAYTETNQENFSFQSLVTVLWILMLQARHFSSGLSVGESVTIPAFANMIMDLGMKREVVHGDVPCSLYSAPAPASEAPKRPGYDIRPPSDPKKPRTTWVDRPDIYNSKMKAAMKPFTFMFPRPTVGQICTAAGTYGNQLFPSQNSGICLKSQLLGGCDKRCSFSHIVLPQEAIDGAIAKLQRVIDNPSLVEKKV